MKSTITIVLLMALYCQASTQVIYVRQNATGEGTSWSDATGDLSKALTLAAPGSSIWVAKGTYQPTQTSDRKAAFVLPGQVKLLGGFAGTETSAEERNPGVNTTTLSGEIGNPGLADNSFNVVYIKNADENTVLDGFVISQGNANGEEGEAGRTRCGGGLYIDGQNGSSKPVIRQCKFIDNHGRDGAAVYINGRSEGLAKPEFVDCLFSKNEAGLDGGAIYNDGRLNGNSNPKFTNCSFEKNIGTYGGAICNATETGICNLTLEDCSFVDNGALLRGGAVFSLHGNEKCYLEMSGCTFTGNFPDDQNMIFTNNSARSKAYQVEKTEP